nr:hypothetical protein [Tanacetum cinerariifolium]
MSILSQISLACNSIVLKDVLSVMFENDNAINFKLVSDMHTMLDSIGMRIRVRAELILEVEKQGYSPKVYESLKLLKDLQETDNVKKQVFVDDAHYDIPVVYNVEGVIEDEELFGKLVDDDVVRVCLLLALKVIIMGKKLVDEVPDTLMRLVENLEVVGRERKGVLLDKSFVAEFFSNISSEYLDALNEEFHELYQTSFIDNRPAENGLDYDDDLVKGMVIQEEEERCRLEELKMNEALFLSSLKEGVRGDTFVNAEKDRPLNALNDQDTTQFLKDVTHWVEDLSRYNKAPDIIHLTDAFHIFLGRQGPLRARFPWYKDASETLVCLDPRKNGWIMDELLQYTVLLWYVDGTKYKVTWSDVEQETLVCLDPRKNGWIMDEHVELWVNYMWHVSPQDADWAMVGGYFVQLLLQYTVLLWYVDGTRMVVSVNTLYSSKLVGFNNDEEPIIKVDDTDEINSNKLDRHCFNVESDFVESLLNHDTFIDFSSKFDFSGELSHIKPEIPKSDFNFEEEIRLIENLLYDNSFPRPPKELNAKIADTIIESIPLPIPVQDSNSQHEEIDIVTETDDVLPPSDDNDDDYDFLLGEADLFLSDDSIPPGIENVADDPEGDIRFLEELLINDSILSYESSYSNFEDNPSNSRPLPEPPDDNFDLEPEVISIVMEDIDEPDKHFNPGGEICVSTKNEDVDYFPFMFVIQIFLPYLILPEISPLFLSTENEDTIFDPGIFE